MRSFIKMDQQRSHDVSSEQESVIKNIPQKNLPVPWLALQNFFLNYLKIPLKTNRPPLGVVGLTLSTEGMEIITVEAPQHYGGSPYSDMESLNQAAEAAIVKIHENRLFLNELIQLSRSIQNRTAMPSSSLQVHASLSVISTEHPSQPTISPGLTEIRNSCSATPATPSLADPLDITSNLFVKATHQADTKSYLERKIARIISAIPVESAANPISALINYCKHQLKVDVDILPGADDADLHTARVYFGLDLLSECRSRSRKTAKTCAAIEALMKLKGKVFSWMPNAVVQDHDRAEMGIFYINKNGDYVVNQNEKVHAGQLPSDQRDEVIRAMEKYEDLKKSFLNGDLTSNIYINSMNKLCQLTERTGHLLKDRQNELLRIYILKGLCIRENLFEPDFDLASWSEESSPKPGTIECKCEEIGLAYRVLGIDGTVKKGLKPWSEKFPQQSIDEIIRDKAKWLPVILAFTSEKGHTTSEIADKLKVHFYPISSRVTQLLGLLFNEKNRSLGSTLPIVDRANFNHMLDVIIKDAFSTFSAQKDRDDSQRGEILTKFFKSPLFEKNLIGGGEEKAPSIFTFFSRNFSAKSAPTVDVEHRARRGAMALNVS